MNNTILDIQLNNDNRYSISGVENIKKYWLFNKLDDIKHELINKKRLNNVDLPNNDIRFSLSEEIEIKKQTKGEIKNIKAFRIKNRYSIFTEDELFRIDITISKNHNNPSESFKMINFDNIVESYEIEIELLHNDKSSKLSEEKLLDEFMKYNYFILSILQKNDIVIDNLNKKNVLRSYKQLTNINTFKFITGKPVTLHLKNIQKSDKFFNILNKYAVTLKADGQCYFLLIDEKGDFYLINGNKDILVLNLKCKVGVIHYLNVNILRKILIY